MTALKFESLNGDTTEIETVVVQRTRYDSLLISRSPHEYCRRETRIMHNGDHLVMMHFFAAESDHDYWESCRDKIREIIDKRKFSTLKMQAPDAPRSSWVSKIKGVFK